MKILNAAVCLASLLLCSPSVSQEAKCPADMVVAKEGVCIDRYEWPNQKGVKPLVYASGIEDARTNYVLDAETLCATAHKRVCEKAEWQHACGDKYPYGATFDPTACNTGKSFKKVDEYKVDHYDKKELARLDQSAPAGSYEKCRSPSGAYDMVGNAEEWVHCPEGLYGWCLMGRYWADPKSSCTYVVTKHHPRWHFYQIGFRCCADMKAQ